MTINRFSSRLERLDKAFLGERLRGARSYKRIAGYFRSSIFELIGEEIEDIPEVRIVCNSELDPRDILVSRAVREAKLKEKWNELPPESESLLHRGSYRRLYELLSRGNVKIKVVAADTLFLHGKAGVIELADGSKTSFLGSVNETRRAFRHNHELLWEDASEDAVAWVEEEFEALWKNGHDLPDAIIQEIKRLSDRVEVQLADCGDEKLPGAVFAEAPIYRAGEQLQPWQRSFVVNFMEHRNTFGKARLLLADEVGVGKTLSLATSAILAALKGDGPVLILCPSTLTHQWQVELKDQLGVPSAVWLSNRKLWVDPAGHVIRTRGEEDITKCPYRIAIVSTGLIFQPTKERELLLRRSYGTVVLDEAHKARRRGGIGAGRDEWNNLLDFMLQIGHRSKNVLLGTATPIQTEVHELWDLLRILNVGAEFVLGRPTVSQWSEEATDLVSGKVTLDDARDAWALIQHPLPPGREHRLFAEIRNALDLDPTQFHAPHAYSSLPGDVREGIQDALERKVNGLHFFQQNNPIIRHTVLRQRRALEDMGLLKRVAVDVHPDPKRVGFAYPGIVFEEAIGLPTNHFFDLAYKAAEAFTAKMRERSSAAGFVRSLLLQRICSSFASGLYTAEKLLTKEILDEEELSADQLNTLAAITEAERVHLQRIVDELSRPEARDPKLATVRYFLTEHQIEGKSWLEHGCIIFSQYYDTAAWVASELAATMPEEPIGLYAGAGKSRMYVGPNHSSVEREDIKSAVRNHQIRLVIATDAAAEGLNLQTLGTLINVDLPWNPSRLEQRLGRIKRFGQARESVDMLNLVYHGTQDEKVYRVLSNRMRDRYDIFGSLPDVIDDEWIDDIEQMEEELDRYWSRRGQAQNAFQLRYRDAVDPQENQWERCSKVLARNDLVERLSEAW